MKQLVVLAVIGLSLGESLPAADLDVKAERAALFRLDKAWAEAAATKDVEKIVSYWADDAQVFPPGQPPVVGKDALRRYVSEALAIPGFSIGWETSEFVVSSAGDVAYGVGTNVVTVHDAQGKPITERGRAVTTWRKGPDGGWKCAVDIWNAEPGPR